MSLKPSNANTLFKPPSGGDLTIQSNDGVDFQVHSVILELASWIFKDMIAVETGVIKLSGNAKTISLILKFIYPNEKTPTITSLDMTSDCLQMAQKYDMSGVIKNIDEQIASNALPHKLLSSDPMRVYQLAARFKLDNTKVAAAPLVSLKPLDLRSSYEIMNLVRKYSPYSLVRMIGLQGSRTKIISDVLFNFNQAPMMPEANWSHYECDRCRKVKQELDSRAHAPPSWVFAWAQAVYNRLLTTSLEDAGELFEPTALLAYNTTLADSFCGVCRSDILMSAARQLQFDQWVKEVKKVLKERLATLELLYTL
ncbi:hypothetical protein CTheo_1168 [Ceratobasidium theobromae]|uniref:BTB domain-containing protein n=1 Tax=Ceratobasidium theobromae TaxID=1582974 RepID=A0A5N5QV86_9AGAM|nr:hypothetical protein CTheo_1168 [Ceratobasidium theobromae]